MTSFPAPASPLFPPAERGDRLPLWVAALLILFVVLRVVDLWHLGGVRKNGRLSTHLTGQVSTQAMQTTLATNSTAKLAYIQSYFQPGQGVSLDSKSLGEALKSAEELQTSTDNSPGAARRVIVLRLLSHLPPLVVGKNGLRPAAAFEPSALAGLSPAEQHLYTAEGRLWADVARGPHLSPAQTDAYAAQIRAIPNIRWWLSPALSVLYGSQGNTVAAARYARRARVQALRTAGPMTVLQLILLALGLGGLGLLMYLALSRRQSASGRPSPAAALWPVLRPTVPAAERRLRAGDLMGVFVLYLLMPDLLGWLLGGFSVPHHVYFAGLLGPWRHRLSALPSSGHTAAVVVLEFFGYLLGAAVPIILLIVLARRRQASIPDELGWNRYRFGKNLLYGVGGYAISLPLVIAVSLAGQHIHAPAPSNPALPLLAGASSLWVQALLVVLATVAAPLTEEFLFRGVFYNAARLRVGIWPAIVLTGLVFGFVHPVGIAEMLPLAVLGGVFAWMAETRQSLVPSILAHCLQNSVATAMLLLALGG